MERRFGWDTHGLPVEMEVERQLGISGPRQIEELGVAEFNDACRRMVEVTTEEWEDTTRRIGRWVDFVNDYKTMDLDFMESVWWVFRALWDKGLIYRDFKVMPYSWAAGTTLSNFEVSLGGYRDVEDPAVTVRLEVLDVPDGSGPARPGDYLTIWTTTPWTLPGNLAVAVGADLDYAAVEEGGSRYWVAASQAAEVFGEDRRPAASAAGRELLGISYRPPFDYFEEQRRRGGFRVLASPEVSTDEGTGLVHMAPAYGEVDLHTLAENGVDALVDPVDMEAKFTGEAPDLAGMHVHEAEETIIGLLRRSGVLMKSERIVHAYPFCYRTDQPLIYKAIPTWFVRVEAVRDRMVELNRSIHWVPEKVGSNRFGKWLENARDWAVSRNRLSGEAASRCGSAGRAGAKSASADGKPWRSVRGCGWTICTSTWSTRSPSPARLVPRRRPAAERTRGRASCAGFPKSWTAGSNPARCRTHRATIRSRTRNGFLGPSPPTSSPRASTRPGVGSIPSMFFRPPCSTTWPSRTAW